ncbi:MAG: succinate dehydrogenase, cytochrome b556 subunit [Pseudomonadota bacterium]
MSNVNRPLSPHLQVYRPQLTSVLSVLHRGTGIILSVGALLITAWVWSICVGGKMFELSHAFFSSWVGKFLMIAWTACTFYHLFNGIRHLVWDTGYGYELKEAYLSGKVVVGSAFILTVLVWVL